MRNKRRGASWLKYLAGCGCTVLLLGAIAAGVGGYFAYRAVSSTFMVDPARVTELAQREAPGAQLPAGFVGAFGMDTKEFQLSAFHDQKGDRNLMLMMMPFKEGQKISHEELIAASDQSSTQNQKGNRKPKKVLKSEELSVDSAAGALPALRRLVEEDGKKAWEYVAFGRAPGQTDHLLVVIGSAPESESTDQFFRDYLKTIKLNSIVTDGPAASATPQGEPEASSTPEASASPEESASPTEEETPADGE